MIILLFVFITYRTETALELSITTTILSLGISYTAFSFAVSFVGIIFYILSLIFVFNIDDIPTVASMTVISLVQFILTLLPFQIKRLRKGMPFLYKIGSTNAGVLISITLLSCVILISTRKFETFTSVSLFLSILFCSFFVFIWWRNKIKQDYLDRLQKSKIEDLQNTVSEKDKDIERLQKEVEALSKIIHRDNKLIPTMTMALSDFLKCCQDKDNEELHKQGEELLDYFNSSAQDRLGIIQEYQAESRTLTTTNVYSIDSLLKYMLNKSHGLHIKFDLTLSASVKYMIENIISEADLNTLLSDLLENAIIASKHSDEKEILVHLGIIDKHYVIEIFDSGIPFDLEVLKNLGIKRTTTHAKEGGSGIGLMTIYELVKHYNASLIIEECLFEKTGFTKKIALIFDQEGQFIINLPYFKETKLI